MLKYSSNLYNEYVINPPTVPTITAEQRIRLRNVFNAVGVLREDYIRRQSPATTTIQTDIPVVDNIPVDGQQMMEYGWYDTVVENGIEEIMDRSGFSRDRAMRTYFNRISPPIDEEMDYNDDDD